MRIGMLGTGASGRLCAVRLAAAAHAVTVVARGEHLRAIRQQGLSLHPGTGVETFAMPASDDASDLGPQDIVLVATKSTAPASVVLDLKSRSAPTRWCPSHGTAWRGGTASDCRRSGCVRRYFRCST